jgi:plasmid stabilization system protein ParE
MKVIIREAAEVDLDHIAEWIAQDGPSAAVRMVKTIRDRISFLETDELAHMGRPGLVEGTRELLERLCTAREIERAQGADACAQSFDLSEIAGAAGKD